MTKYIDAEKLIEKIRALSSESCISEEDEYFDFAKSRIIDTIESLQQEQQMKIEEEITNTTRACCNCVNGIVHYPSCYCWQHKHCNTDDAYKIPKGLWLETAKDCEAFELDNN